MIVSAAAIAVAVSCTCSPSPRRIAGMPAPIRAALLAPNWTMPTDEFKGTPGEGVDRHGEPLAMSSSAAVSVIQASDGQAIDVPVDVMVEGV